MLLFDRLVTSSGSKVAYREDDLVQDAGKNGSRVPKILQALVDERILHSMAPRYDRPQVKLYEVSHDVLAPSIRDWRTAQVIRQRTLRQFLLMGVAALGVVVILVGIRLWQDKASAESEARQHRANEWAWIASAQTAENPELALWLAAFAAYETYHKDQILTARAEKSLRQALRAWHGDFALVGLEGGAQDIAYCPDARHLATVGSDGSAGIWNAASGELKHMIVAADKPLYAVACSPDSKHLAVAGVDGTVRIIETESGEMEFELPPAYREKRLVAILDVAFGPKGRFLATGGTDNNVRVWEIGGESLSPHLLRGHTGPVNAVSFTADGEGLFSGSNDGSARLWDPESGKELLALDSRGESGSSRTMESHTQPVSEVAFGLVTRLIALASAGAPTQPWNITGGSVALPHDIQHSAVPRLR